MIADDHEVTRLGIQRILLDRFPGVQVAEAADMASTVAHVRDHACDLILLDVMMPGENIIAVLKKIRMLNASVPILILTAATELEYVVQTMKAGANGVIHKHRAAEDLLDAITKVASGGNYLHPDTAAAVATSLVPSSNPSPHTKLSSRELEIFRLIASGRAVKEIAGDLELSEKTVATYLARIREKTGLTSHVEIARYALQHRLVDWCVGNLLTVEPQHFRWARERGPR